MLFFVDNKFIKIIIQQQRADNAFKIRRTWRAEITHTLHTSMAKKYLPRDHNISVETNGMGIRAIL